MMHSQCTVIASWLVADTLSAYNKSDYSRLIDLEQELLFTIGILLMRKGRK
jgi:hypothetical protein